jgi:hypothetical protein
MNIGGLLICAALSALGFSGQPKAKLNDLSWIIGTWKRETEKSVTIETWTRLSPRTIEGISHRIAKATGDTVFTEYLLLAEMEREVFYIPKIAENEYPVPFKMIEVEAGRKAIFSNPNHDFPQKISYELQADGTLLAVTSGLENGKERQIPFHFQRRE